MAFCIAAVATIATITAIAIAAVTVAAISVTTVLAILAIAIIVAILTLRHIYAIKYDARVLELTLTRQIVEHTDIRALLAQMPQCHAIATTGEKATIEVCTYFNVDTIPSPNTKVALEDSLSLYRLPSSSRAFPLSFDKKVEAYRRMFEAVFGC